MKRLRRILFNGLAAVSALLCVAMVTTWTQLGAIELTLSHAGRWYLEGVWMTPDGIDIYIGQNYSRDEHPGYECKVSPSSGFGTYQYSFQPYRRAPGLYFFSGRNPAYRFAAIILSLWWVVFITALLPAVWLVRGFRRSSEESVKCAACGYDLRATPDRCPECGRKPDNIVLESIVKKSD